MLQCYMKNIVTIAFDPPTQNSYHDFTIKEICYHLYQVLPDYPISYLAV